MIRPKQESIPSERNHSFRILLTPRLNEIFYWHFHPEVELVFAEAVHGIRHIGDHVSSWKGSDLALIGSNIPHLNFDYGVKTTVDTVVVQMMENFLGDTFLETPEASRIKDLFLRSRTGLAFYGKTKEEAGQMLKALPEKEGFGQLLHLLAVFDLLARSSEVINLNARPIEGKAAEKERERLNKIYRHVEEHFMQPVDVTAAAAVADLSVPAFCRYFKKQVKLTYTDFVNQHRINQAKRLLLRDSNVSEACFASGFENLAYFNRVFKKITGVNPSVFRKTRGIYSTD
jgi:AraC-like DNA-binding protein